MCESVRFSLSSRTVASPGVSASLLGRDASGFEKLVTDAVTIAREQMNPQDGNFAPFAVTEDKNGEGGIAVIRGDFHYPSEIYHQLIQAHQEKDLAPAGRFSSHQS